MRWPLLLVAILAGCSIENLFSGREDPDRPPRDEDTDESADTDDTDPVVIAEECNGADDDGDGLVDEDFPDDNGNGRADCLDPDCPERECALVAVGSDACPVELSPTPDAWNVVEAWRWSYSVEANNSYTSPVVARLRDDDGDGDIDLDDQAYVVAVAFKFGGGDAWLAALDGVTGLPIWTHADVDAYSGVAVADVDADGEPEILVFGESGHILALSAAGEVEWVSEDTPAYAVEQRSIAVADLDGDGSPEVVADTLVINGRSGRTLAKLAVDTTVYGHRIPSVGDVDLDGDQEILLANRLFEADGTLLWEVPEEPRIMIAAALVQADCDPEAEIVFAGRDLGLYEHDGTPIWRQVSATDEATGILCVGDADGDGAPEILRPHGTVLEAWTLAGSLLWEARIEDGSSAAGCAAWDLDGDGALEVLIADEMVFRILDGRTGSLLYGDILHDSYTSIEAPVVSDLDGDGSAEIVIVKSCSDCPSDAIRVYTHAGAGWDAGANWPIYGFSLTNAPAADGAVPASPRPPWLDESVTRAGPDTLQGGAPDLRAEVVGTCIADCEWGPVEVYVRVENRGTAHSGDFVPVALYTSDGSDPRLVGVQTVPPIRRGWAMDALTFSVPAAEVGTMGFTAIADDDGSGLGAIEECDQHTDGALWEDGCP